VKTSQVLLFVKYGHGHKIDGNATGGQVACTGENESEQTLSVENLTKRSEGQGMYGRIILKWNFKKQTGRIWNGLI